jgi:hypothetical protein
MYGKIFSSIYEGTLYGHWEAIVTMQQLIVLATPDGVIDMTPQAIAARTSIPFEIISKGLKVLGEPDPYSRTPGEDGRRIVAIDSHRPWGWRLVNHWKYMAMRDMEAKRKADRERLAEKRREINNVANVSQGVANVAHVDTDVHVHKDIKETPTAPDASRRPPKANGRHVSFDFSKGAFQGITEDDELRWQEAYPAVPIPPAISQAAAWLKANPANKKSNYERFLVNWFKRDQDKAGRVKH